MKLAYLITLAFISLLVFNQFLGDKITVPVNLPKSDKNLAQILSSDIVLPIKWGDLGKKMMEAGVIDEQKFLTLYENRGGLTKEEQELLYSENNEKLTINSRNAGFLLNLLWAFGLANKNPILEEGPMQKYGDASRFASTGGWTIAKGEAMDHYSRHPFVALTLKQQELVERTAKNIYRPCCGNSTYFPDCNHGMAMLALLELMAAQGVSEEEMYKTALIVNAFWFPDAYLTIEKYFGKRGIGWQEIDPKTALGSAYSSAHGYRGILKEIEPPESQGRGGCGI